MGLNASKKEYNNTDRPEVEPLDPGTYPARLVQIIDLGVQEQRPFKGEPKPPAQEIMTTYEFVDEFMKDENGDDIEDKPRWLSENIPLHSLNSDLAKSTKRYYALDPQGEYGGNWPDLISAPAMVTITQSKSEKNGKIYNNIKSTSSMRPKEAAKLPELKNDGKVFDQSDLTTMEVFFTLPKWIQDTITKGLEWDGSDMAKAVANRGKPAKEEKPKKEAKAAKVVKEDIEVVDEEEEENW